MWFLRIHTSINAHNEQYLKTEMIIYFFPSLFWLAYPPMPCLQIFNQIQHLRNNNFWLGLWEEHFSMQQKKTTTKHPTNFP